MPSTFTWLDYSESDRRKMLDVIELFGERTTRDELGLGGIRDAFADMLFPGTSTIQTRAKYFLFVPWIYRVLEDKRVSSGSIATKARNVETKLIVALTAAGEIGIIGGRAKENLQRLPSSIYWQGLGAWGIRVFPGSQDEYHRSLDLFYARRDAHRASRREFDGESQDEPGRTNWHSGLPPKPDDFPDIATFELESAEAEYLRERILTRCTKSLLAILVRDRINVAGIEFAWELSAQLPGYLKEQLEHGRSFSETLLGAQLLYNLMLARLQQWEDGIRDYQDRLSQWWQVMTARRQDLSSWNRPRFWQIVYQGNPRVSPQARAFVNSWLDIIFRAPDLPRIVDSPHVRQLIEYREVQLKAGLARLRNRRALELWPGAAGDRQLDLRWTSAKRLIQDIVDGLEGTSNA